MPEEDYILRQCASGVIMDMYLGLRTGQVLSITFLFTAADVQLQRKWKGMCYRDFTATTQPQERGYCSDITLRNRAAVRNTEAMCILHPTPMHYNVVIALKQGLQVDLIWCDSRQRNSQHAVYTYSQYHHFLETDVNSPQCFQPNRHYSSALTTRSHSSMLP